MTGQTPPLRLVETKFAGLGLKHRALLLVFLSCFQIQAVMNFFICKTFELEGHTKKMGKVFGYNSIFFARKDGMDGIK